MALEYIDEDLCNGCRICIDSCPLDCIGFDEVRQKAYPAYPGDCMVCLLCESDCSEGAILITPERSRPIPLPW